MASITTTSTFTSLAVDCIDAHQGRWSIYYELSSEEVGRRLQFRIVDSTVVYDTTGEETDLGTLQTIWASDDGFQDGSSNDLDVEVNNFIFGDTLADLSANPNFFNPFDVDDVARFLQTAQYLGLLRRNDGAVTTNTDGVMQATIQGNLATTDSEVAGLSFDQPLDRWEVASRGNGVYVFSIAFELSEEIVLTALVDDKNIQGMFALLESLRTAGAALSITDPTNVDQWGNRTFTATVGDDTWIFARNPAGLVYSVADGYVTGYDLWMKNTSASDELTGAEARSFIRSSVGTLTVAEGDPIAKTAIGNKDQIYEVFRLIGPDGTEIRFKNGSIVKHMKDRAYPIGPGFGLSKIYSDLSREDPDDATTPYLLDDDENSNIIDVSDAPTGTQFKIPAPSDLLNYDYNNRTIYLENQGNKTFDFLDWDDNKILNIKENDTVELVVMRAGSGEGKLLVREPPERLFYIHRLDADRFHNFPEIEYSSPAQSLLFVRFHDLLSTAAGDVFDDDVFEKSDTNVVPTTYEFSDLTADDPFVVDRRGSWKFLREGFARIRILMDILSSPNGGTPSGRLSDFKVSLCYGDPNGKPYAIRNADVAGFTAPGKVSLDVTWILDPNPDYWYFIGIFVPNTTTMQQKFIKIENPQRRIEFTPKIILTDG